MPDLKLARIPERKPVKFVVEILPDLEQALEDYAAAYEAEYGKREKASDLVPFMLWAFLENDREFLRRNSRKPSP